MDLQFELGQIQVVMHVFSYLPSPIIRFQGLNRRFYRTLLPQWVGFVTFLDLRIRVLPRPVHAAHGTYYSFPGDEYIRGLTSLEKGSLTVCGFRCDKGSGSLELALSTGRKSNPGSNLIYSYIPQKQILSIQIYYDLRQKWIGIALCCGDSQYACG